VHAVGDVADRDLVFGPARKDAMPHRACDLSVPRAHAVGGSADAKPEGRHAQWAAGIGEIDAGKREELVPFGPEPLREALVGVPDLVDRVGFVSRGDGRVGREDGARAGGLERVGERPTGGDVGGRQLDRGHARVALVQVHDRRSDAQSLKRSDAAEAEQRVLREARVAIAHVESARDPAVDRAVLRARRVEEIERDGSDVDPPDLGRHVAAADRDGDREGRPVLARHERDRQPLGVDIDPILVLPAARIDSLPEVALPVEQADRHHRQTGVGGGLQQVAREHAEPSRIDRERGMDPVLRTEEGDGAVGGEPVVVRRQARLGGQGFLRRAGSPAQVVVDRRALERGARRLLQQTNRVVAADFPAVRIDGGEEPGTAREPRPAVVVGKTRERREGSWQAFRELIRGAAKIVGSGWGKHAGCVL
jgi:hypothetical protein